MGKLIKEGSRQVWKWNLSKNELFYDFNMALLSLNIYFLVIMNFGGLSINIIKILISMFYGKNYVTNLLT